MLAPLTGGASSINIYGAIGGTTVYRPNALTGDPNHLAVMLCVPILMLLPVYLRLERGHRLRVPLAVVLAFLFLVQLATLSRSGLLGIVVGLLVLAVPYRRRSPRGRCSCRSPASPSLLAAIVWERRHYFEVLVRSRVQTGGSSESAHFAVYDFVPQILHSHPLFGLGLNTFSVYYEFVTGKSNWGPHSFYVALIVETGLVGAFAFFVFLRYLFARLHAARALGRRLAAEGVAAAARVRPLAWGMTAALAGTMAANLFYLTMQFYYFYAFAVLVLALPIVFARRASHVLSWRVIACGTCRRGRDDHCQPSTYVKAVSASRCHREQRTVRSRSTIARSPAATAFIARSDSRLRSPSHAVANRDLSSSHRPAPPPRDAVRPGVCRALVAVLPHAATSIGH